MFDFIETASAIRVLYNHVKDCLQEEDFWPLTQEQYAKLSPEQQSENWFMINPSKLRDKAEIWIVDENEKNAVFRAIKFIQKTTDELPETSSFLERLLYAKKNLPPVFFEQLKD